MSEKYDVVVVGAGPSGLSAAYFLADEGFNVIVLERGSEPGSKNVFGGRIYSYVLDKYFPGWRETAPIERWVRRENISILCGDDRVNLEYCMDRKTGGHDSFTAFLSKFLKWFSLKVEEKNVTLATSVRVDEILFKDGEAYGVRAGGDKLEAEYIIVAEGANTLLLERHRLREKATIKDVAVGVKEVIKLGRDRINERFNIDDGEGSAYFLIGSRFGGGFIYTMKEYVSIGAIYKPLLNNRVDAKDVIEELRMHPSIYKLVGDGVPIEYSADMIREAGYRDMMPKPYGRGYIVVGDAAGLILNTGFTVRGVDLAIESGRIAAEAIKRTPPGEEPSIYLKLLRDGGIIPTLKKFGKVSKTLSNQKIYMEYPELICEIFKKIYTVEEFPETLYESIKEIVGGKASIVRFLLELLSTVRGL